MTTSEPGGTRPSTAPAGLVRVLPAGTMEGVSIDDHLRVAATTGFHAISLRPRHLRDWLHRGPGRSSSGLVARLADLALGVAELDPVVGWSDPRRWPSHHLPDAAIADLELAAAVGARAVTALVAPGEPWEDGPGAEGLAALCAAALERGVRVQIEPFGWSALHDVATAVAAIRESGATNAGVLVDTWHHQRRGGDLAAIAALATMEVAGLQVSDGPAEPVDGDLQADCFAARTWPGDPSGELHPERVLASLLDRGWSGPVAVEVFGDASADPIGRARRAAEAFDAMLSATRR